MSTDARAADSATVSLSDDQRRALERAVVSAREAAEQGARAALEQLGVGTAQPYKHLSAVERDLRRRLRARARQLGDSRQSDGTHETEHLVREVAYEHWHRMLFARFLAENDLLMHPDGVPVTLEECEQLAEEEGVVDGWELAGRYAARMLPQILRPDAPALEVQLAPEYRQELEGLLEELDAEIFTARDALGWVYQYWQSKRKDEVNASEVKIGADELPAVTQLFTEPYMVHFLLENSLGAWWESRHPDEPLPVEMPYLRHTEDGEPAAGTFDGWPDRAAELKVLDPCCGSGHFLVEALHLLVPMRMQEERLSARAACDVVLRDNLYGLEIDPRCTEIAAFALALTAWTYPGAEGYRELPEMHIACSGLSVGAKEEDWVAYAKGDQRLERGMRRLYELFQDAPTLGSLIDPTRDNGDLFEARYEELEPLLQQALKEEEPDDYRAHEIGVTAQGIAKAAKLLAKPYHLVTTNVPYLHKSKQSRKLSEFCRQQYPSGYYDLAACFLERGLDAVTEGGMVSMVLPYNWTFLTSYQKFREKLLRTVSWKLIAKLGPQAFQTSLWDFNIQLLQLKKTSPSKQSQLMGLDVADIDDIRRKSDELKSEALTVRSIEQLSQLDNPDGRILLKDIDFSEQLSDYARSLQGISPSDRNRFARKFWEINRSDLCDSKWRYWQSSVDETCMFAGREEVLNMGPSLQRFVDIGKAYIRGEDAWGRRGVGVRIIGSLPCTITSGDPWDTNVAVIVPERDEYLPALWCFCSSEEYNRTVRLVDEKVSVTNATLAKVPFDLEHWQEVAEERFSKGLPEPYSEDPTQWIFEGTVTPSERPLEVAVARLLGYEWPEQVEDGLSELADEDGIVCIPAVGGEQPAASSLQQRLARAYGDEWGPGKSESLLSEVGFGGATLEEWLRDGFFEQHCELFEHRPFIWHVWDGRKDGFGALVNYHKLDRSHLERLTYTYLNDWIRRQKREVEQDLEAAEARLHAAQDLQEKLKLILEGEEPYDIFVRWKPLEEQPIGWEPDLDDGVRQNIRPFMKAEVLRKRPKVKWTNDRGKDPEDAPWYEEFGGKRVNDHHLSLEEKKQARKSAADQ